jgi:hypothetical protein
LPTLTAHQTLIDIPTPNTHHAFLIAPVIAHDPGKGDLIDLELPDHTFLRSQAAPDVLRLGPNISGSWQATLHFSTHSDASLKEPLRLPRLKPCPAHDETHLPTWGAAGLITHLDLKEGLITIRVIPQRENLQAFLITAIASLEQLTGLQSTSNLRLKGTLRGRQLIAMHLERIDLEPEHLPSSAQNPIRGAIRVSQSQRTSEKIADNSNNQIDGHQIKTVKERSGR